MTITTSNYTGGEINRDETFSLIASDKVEGTAVYDLKGEKIGHIHNFMVNKVSGTVAYAVLSFGGFLGMGSDYFPLPWDRLTYDIALGGYVIDLDRNLLEDAPHYALGEESAFDTDYRRDVDAHWARPFSA